MERNRVRVLPAELANRIAAGEVVQRPASAVKELLENAVDAGASRVKIRLRGAGLDEVLVTDDGTGMSRADALTALERHATSKLVVAEDLDRIDTLGFRGEALPSIAAVSRFRLRTRQAGDPHGTEVVLQGGRVEGIEAVAVAPGTEVVIGDLFYNVPARRKFLKTPATEQRNVVAVVTQQALVHFDVGFELRTENRRLLLVPPGQSLEERAAEVVGAEARGGLFWHRVEDVAGTLWFAFAAPHEGRGQSRALRLFVNRRPVQDRMLVRAVLEGYRGLLESRRYPVALLWLQLPPEAVDVNVHPAKHEVRFRDEGRVFRRVAGAVAEALARTPWLQGGTEATLTGRGRLVPPPTENVDGYHARVAEALNTYARRPGVLSAPMGPGSVRRTTPEHVPQFASQGFSTATAASPEGPFGTLRYLGAFDATYLIFEDLGARELVLLDQHAAHERILYERLLGLPGVEAVAQPLLLPVVLECSAEELAGVDALAAVFAGLGLEIERFGTSSVAVSAAPVGLAATRVEAVVRDLLAADELTAAEGEARRLEAAAKRAACAAAVKARAGLDASEVAQLLVDLGGLRNPSHCPHGRPLIRRLARGEIEALFHRR